MKPTIGIIDYGLGNLSSVYYSLRDLGYPVRISSDKALLKEADVLLIPGVGAFSVAVNSLKEKGLFDFILEQASQKKPILGICLGMQLLTDASHEHQFNRGLSLIPGEIIPFEGLTPHIGWNTIENFNGKGWQESNQEAFYFNHTYHYSGPEEHQICLTNFQKPFAAIIKKDNVIGLQFHPEKSQTAGRRLLRTIIEGFTNA